MSEEKIEVEAEIVAEIVLTEFQRMEQLVKDIQKDTQKRIQMINESNEILTSNMQMMMKTMMNGFKELK